MTNAYPRKDLPDYGVFIQEQIESLDPDTVHSTVRVIAGRGGMRGYLTSVPGLRVAARHVDLVHCHHMLCGLVALLAGLRKRTIVSFTSDGALNFKRRPLWVGRLMFSIVSRCSAYNIFKSHVPGGMEQKSALLPNGVDTTRFDVRDKLAAKRNLGLDVDGHYVLFVSAVRLNRPEKRYDLFLETINTLERRRPGYFQPLTMTNVPRDRVHLYYQAATVHLLTSDVEGSPNSVKESLASGTPVVAHDVGGVAALLRDVPGCGLFSTYEAEVVATLIERSVCAVPNQVRSAFLAKNLDMKAIARRMEAVYANVASRLPLRENK